MFPMIETAIAFSVIMLMISFLVKSLVSLVKNHFHYFATHLEHEVKRLLIDSIATLNAKTIHTTYPKLKGIQWKQLGEEYLTEANIKILLQKIGVNPVGISDLKERVELHRANVIYAFDRRMKNLALVCGVGLCLALNINAFAIWKTLYNDAELRSRYAAPDKVTAVLKQYDEELREFDASGQDGGDTKLTEAERTKKLEELAAERKRFVESVVEFKEDVSFGVGAVWASPSPEKGNPPDDTSTKEVSIPLEFLGSLLTGLFVSIGAPYLHDFLRSISGIREKLT